MLRDAGFVDIKVDVKEESAKYIAEWMPGSGAEEFVASASITARKSGVTPAAAARPKPKKSSGACGPSTSGSKKGG